MDGGTLIVKLLCRILGHNWHAQTDGTHSAGYCLRCWRFEFDLPEWEGRW